MVKQSRDRKDFTLSNLCAELLNSPRDSTGPNNLWLSNPVLSLQITFLNFIFKIYINNRAKKFLKIKKAGLIFIGSARGIIVI